MDSDEISPRAPRLSLSTLWLIYIFHGHYDANGQLNRAPVERFGLLDWIIKYSGGKADRDSAQRWIKIELNTGMVAFMHPQQDALA